MTRGEFTKRALFAGGGALIWMPVAAHTHHGPHFTMPHIRRRPHHPASLKVTKIRANVSIKGQIATTELLLSFENPDRIAKEGRALLAG